MPASRSAPTVEGNRIIADLVMYNGTVLTLSDRSVVASAIACVGDRIVAVGGDAEMRALAGGGTRVVDLRGATIVPGLVDNHTHMLLAGMDTASAGVKVNISLCRSIADIKAEIAAATRRAEPGQWIVTSSLYRGSIAERRFPNRHDLDEAAPNNPVYLADGGRNIIVNSRALDLAGITRETPDPGSDPDVAEGHIVRDAAGSPTGHLIVGAGDLARQRWWARLGQPAKMWDLIEYDLETNIRALKAQMRAFNAVGITGTREMGLNTSEVDAYLELDARGEATVRTDLILGLPAHYLSTQDIAGALDTYFGPKQGLASDWVRIGGLKIVAQNYGWWTLQPAKLRSLIIEGNRRGWTFAIHGTPGDLGTDIEVILDALEAADAERPLAGRRWSYEHCFGLVQPDYYQRLGRMGITLACNPLLSYFAAGRSVQMHEVLEQVRIAKSNTALTGMERAVREWAQPVRSWSEAGLLVTAGTDCPAVPHDPDHPLRGLWATFSQHTLAGILMPDEVISRELALRMWTVNGAYASFEEHRRGSLEPGKFADFAVLSANPLTAPDDEFLDIKVLETVAGGQSVFERSTV
jgi:predicted amidohydrolase YtcJ